jgi:hypothetical protein
MCEGPPSSMSHAALGPLELLSRQLLELPYRLRAVDRLDGDSMSAVTLLV